MDSTSFQKEIYELKQSVEELKSEFTLALTRIGDKLSTHSQNYLELKSKIEQLSTAYNADEDSFAEVQDEHSNRDSTTNPSD